MATLIDLLRHLGQNAAPDGGNALVGPVVLPGVSDSALTLALPHASGNRLVAAWTRAVGRVTLGHHALALSAVQTNYSVALMGHGCAAHDDLLLVLLLQLLAQPGRTALCVIPPDSHAFRTKLTSLADAVALPWIDPGQPGSRPRPARLVLATPEDLHRRVLHFHDRAWRWLWPRLRFLALPELHQHVGAPAGHLHWLLRRVRRLQAAATLDQALPLQILGSLAPVSDADATLTRLFGEPSRTTLLPHPALDAPPPLRIVAAPDGPAHNTLVVLWRCGADRAAALTRLVESLSARRLALTVLGRDEAETHDFRTKLSASGHSPAAEDAQIALVSGIPQTSAARQALLRGGYRLVVLLVGNEPHELLFADQPDLLLHTLPFWPLATANPYIAAEHLVCAAAERPLEESEIDRWNVRELRDRLLKKGLLHALPDADLWHSAAVDDPYSALDPRTIGGPPAALYAPDGTQIGSVSPALLDRCALPGQIVQPGWRVASRDEATGAIQLAADQSGAISLVLAEVSVVVREELAARSVRFGKITTELVKGKVLATQQVLGLRELRPDGSRRELPLPGWAETQWAAAACWLPLPAPAEQALQNSADTRYPPLIGWALTQVLPLVTLAAPSALITSYDVAQQRLYVIEAEPGGMGLIGGVYEQFERLIAHATSLAVACAASPMYAELAECELSWINALKLSAPPVPEAVLATEDERPNTSQPQAQQPVSAPPVAKRAAQARVYAQPPHAPLSAQPRMETSSKRPIPIATARAEMDSMPQAPAKPAEPALAAPQNRANSVAASNTPGQIAATGGPGGAEPPTLVPEVNTAQAREPDSQEPAHTAKAVAADTHTDAPAVPVPSIPVRRATVYDFRPPAMPRAIGAEDAPDQDAEATQQAEPTAASAAPRQPFTPAQRSIADLLPPLPEDADEDDQEQLLEAADTQPIKPVDATSAARAQPAPDDNDDLVWGEPSVPQAAPRPTPRWAAQRTDRRQSSTTNPRPPRFGRSDMDQPPRPPAPQPPAPRLDQRPERSTRANTPPTDAQPPARGRTDHGGANPPADRRPAPQRGTPLPTRGQPPPQHAAPNRTPQHPAAHVTPPAETPAEPADVNAMIARMRRLREQREAEQQGSAGRSQAPAPTRETAPEAPVELRFHIGERVQCLPYGTGIVRSSRLIDGRELVHIEFPEYGEIEVDPTVSLVRQLPASGVDNQAEWRDDEATDG